MSVMNQFKTFERLKQYNTRDEYTLLQRATTRKVYSKKELSTDVYRFHRYLAYFALTHDPEDLRFVIRDIKNFLSHYYSKYECMTYFHQSSKFISAKLLDILDS